jgi:starch-binding outer membrane protein, SusD/RagB family
MKNKFFTLLTIGLSFLLITSCDDQLNQEPFSQLSDEQFWKTNNDASAGVAAIYDAMQKHYSARHYYWGEFRADTYVATPTAAGDNLSIVNNAITSNFSGAISWSNMYQMIARANLAIQKIPKIEGYNPELLAEALFLRAYAYFDAIRVWGDVPLFTEPVTALTDDAFKTRESKDKILNEIVLPDMIKAGQLMATRTNQFRASKAAILNFQGEVYMWLKDWAKAKAAFAEVEGYGAYTLVTTRAAWNDMFSNDIVNGTQVKKMTGSELIFSIRYNQTEDSDRAGIYNLFFAGLPSFYVDSLLERKWETRFPIDSTAWAAAYPGIKSAQTNPVNGQTFYGDFRFIESREQGTNILRGGARVAKWNKININGAFDDTDIHVFRYASMLYNMAEVEAMLGNNAGAIAILNRIRKARLLPDVRQTLTTQSALIDYILDEKQFETIGEGDRWWDLVRQNKAIPILGPRNKMNEQTIFWPIFRGHIINNPKLTQNPGYN